MNGDPGLYPGPGFYPKFYSKQCHKQTERWQYHANS